MYINRLLSSYIQQKIDGRGLLLYRDENELSFLQSWLVREKKTVIDDKKDDYTGTVEEIIKNCHRCDNIYNKKPGFGSGENGVFIVLNTPRVNSDAEKERLKPESIDLLRKMIKAMNLDFNECYITNLIKCESRDVMNRPSMMFKNCEGIFLKELKEKRPAVVIIMGDSLPLRRIITDHKTTSWHKIDHPLTLVKNPELKRPAWEELKKVMIELKIAGE